MQPRIISRRTFMRSLSTAVAGAVVLPTAVKIFLPLRSREWWWYYPPGSLTDQNAWYIKTRLDAGRTFSYRVSADSDLTEESLERAMVELSDSMRMRSYPRMANAEHIRLATYGDPWSEANEILGRARTEPQSGSGI
jgi:hypothetical protein